LAGTTWGPDRYAYMPDERSSRPYVFLYFQMCASWASKFWLAPAVTRLLWATVPAPHARLLWLSISASVEPSETATKFHQNCANFTKLENCRYHELFSFLWKEGKNFASSIN
jgi:hypothetical protein